jgi:nitrogen regulatory protein P-II 1
MNAIHLLVVVLNREEFLEDILTAFVEAGVSGATIIDSVGMGRVLAYDVPIFAGLRKTMDGQRSAPYNKTIFTVIPDENMLHKTISLLEKVLDLDVPGTGLLFVLPITMVKGLATGGLEL